MVEIIKIVNTEADNKEIRENLEWIVLFIDHANVFHNLQRLNVRIDWRKFKEHLSRNKWLSGTLLYMGLPKNLFPKKKRFVVYLEKQGFVIISKRIKESAHGKKRQVGVDIAIYKHMTELASEDAYDTAVLVSGDEDLLDAVREVKKFGKRVEIWGFKNSTSQKLIKEVGVENMRYVDDILDDIRKEPG